MLYIWDYGRLERGNCRKNYFLKVSDHIKRLQPLSTFPENQVLGLKTAMKHGVGHGIRKFLQTVSLMMINNFIHYQNFMKNNLK